MTRRRVTGRRRGRYVARAREGDKRRAGNEEAAERAIDMAANGILSKTSEIIRLEVLFRCQTGVGQYMAEVEFYLLLKGIL